MVQQVKRFRSKLNAGAFVVEQNCLRLPVVFHESYLNYFDGKLDASRRLTVAVANVFHRQP
jgi:hypothetical protein